MSVNKKVTVPVGNRDAVVIPQKSTAFGRQGACFYSLVVELCGCRRSRDLDHEHEGKSSAVLRYGPTGLSPEDTMSATPPRQPHQDTDDPKTTASLRTAATRAVRAIGRGEIITRCSAALMAGFAAFAGSASRATAAKTGLPNPLWKYTNHVPGTAFADNVAHAMALTAGPFNQKPKSGAAPSVLPGGFLDCKYVAVVLKDRGMPNPTVVTAADLAYNNVSVPDGLTMVGAFKIGHDMQPYISGTDELRVYHGTQNAAANSNDPGQDLIYMIGDHFDVYILIYA